METIYKEGVVFRSKTQKHFKVVATGVETISFFEALKITGSGLPVLYQHKNYKKDAFEIEPSREEELLKRFSKEFQEKFIHDPYVNKVITLLLSGSNPYNVVEELLIAYKELADDYTRLLMENDLL